MAPVTRRSKTAEVLEEDKFLNSQGDTDQESVKSKADIEGEAPSGSVLRQLLDLSTRSMQVLQIIVQSAKKPRGSQHYSGLKDQQKPGGLKMGPQSCKITSIQLLLHRQF